MTFSRKVVFFTTALLMSAVVHAQNETEAAIGQYINDHYTNGLPCTATIEVTAANAVATVTFPQLSCVTDDDGQILKSSYVGGTVTLFTYVKLPGLGGEYPSGTVAKDGSVTITFDLPKEGPLFMVVDPTFKNGQTRGWIGPSNDPVDQFLQMHGGHVVTGLAFFDGEVARFSPRHKEMICLRTPSNNKEVNNPSVCHRDLQPQSVSDSDKDVEGQ